LYPVSCWLKYLRRCAAYGMSTAGLRRQQNAGRLTLPTKPRVRRILHTNQSPSSLWEWRLPLVAGLSLAVPLLCLPAWLGRVAVAAASYLAPATLGLVFGVPPPSICSSSEPPRYL